METAFFDLDKTVIARSSMMAFAPSFRRRGLLSRRAVLRGAWLQLLYLRWGAGPTQLARIQSAALATTKGWSRAEVSEAVSANLDDAVGPITYLEALERFGEHRAAGRSLVLVSAAPEEVVVPIGGRLGVDRVIASRALVDEEGRYTGRLERWAYGAAKAALMHEMAQRDGIDLEASWAYTDSFTDLPMLEAVGHPVAVNPDRALRRVAHMRSWPVERFETRAGVTISSESAVAGMIEEDMASAGRRWGFVPALAVALTTGGITAWWMLRRPARTAA